MTCSAREDEEEDCCVHDPLPGTKAAREGTAFCCWCGDGYLSNTQPGEEHGPYAPKIKKTRKR